MGSCPRHEPEPGHGSPPARRAPHVMKAAEETASSAVISARAEAVSCFRSGVRTHRLEVARQRSHEQRKLEGRMCGHLPVTPVMTEECLLNLDARRALAGTR